MLIPQTLVSMWRGSIDPHTESHLNLDNEHPQTDYDRACVAAWPGKAQVRLGTSSALVIYSEYDEHAWMAEERVVASGSWSLHTSNSNSRIGQIRFTGMQILKTTT
jgi:hypothetical protein